MVDPTLHLDPERVLRILDADAARLLQQDIAEFDGALAEFEEKLRSKIRPDAPVRGVALKLWGAFLLVASLLKSIAETKQESERMNAAAGALLAAMDARSKKPPERLTAEARREERMQLVKWMRTLQLADNLRVSADHRANQGPEAVKRVTVECAHLRSVIELEVPFPIDLQKRVYLAIDELVGWLDGGSLPRTEPFTDLIFELRALSRARGEPQKSDESQGLSPLPIDLATLDSVDIAALTVLVEHAHELKPKSSGDIAGIINNRYPKSPTSAQRLRETTFPKLRPLLESTVKGRSRGQKLRRTMVGPARAILERSGRK